MLTILLTAFSWFVLGAWYGWGYCLCTDWHWQVREALGMHDQQDSYIRFLIYKLSGWKADPVLVDNTVLAVFLLAAALTVILNLRDWKKGRVSR